MSSLRSRLINSRLAPNSSTHSSTLHSSLRLQRRSYAVLVNRSTSVDSSFGNTPPPAPNQDSNSSPSLRTRTPIGAQVSGSPFPNRDPINQNTPPSSWGRGLGGKAPNPPSSPIKAANLNQQSNQGSTSDRDREHPHPASIPDQNGNFNSLDSKILKAARALLLQEQKDSPSSSSTIRTDTSDTTSSPSDLKQLLSSFSSLANHQLPFSLPYEPTPDQARKVPLTTARSTPSEIELAKDDGVVLVAYVDGLEIEGSETGGSKGPEPKISVCSGFAVEGKKWLADKGVGKGELLITCAHTLQSCLPRSSSSSSTTSTSSLGLVMTRTGQVYRIHSLLSSLPTSDLILLQLSEKPISVDSEEEALPAKSGLRTLPLSPYPSPVGTELCVSSFSGWENDSIANAFGQAAAAFSKSSTSSNNSSSDTSVHGLKPNPNFDSNPIKASSEAEERARARGRWGRARLVEYKDPSGREARTGTYDELSQLEFKVLTDSNDNLPPFMTSTSSSQQSPSSSSSSSSSSSQDQVETTNTSNNLPFFSTLSNFPPPGSSGGPVVESSTGAVVGVVRGSKMSALEGRRGDAIPAEKIFEFFALPGIGNKKL